MCACIVFSTSFYFHVRQFRRQFIGLCTGAFVNQLILRLFKLSAVETDRRNAQLFTATEMRHPSNNTQLTRITLTRQPCSSHQLEAGHSVIHTVRIQDSISEPRDCYQLPVNERSEFQVRTPEARNCSQPPFHVQICAHHNITITVLTERMPYVL
jgi:hypothetical protein